MYVEYLLDWEHESCKSKIVLEVGLFEAKSHDKSHEKLKGLIEMSLSRLDIWEWG